MPSFSHLPYHSYPNPKCHWWHNSCHLPSHCHPPDNPVPYPNHPDPLPHCSMPSPLSFGARDTDVNTSQWSYTSNQDLNRSQIVPWKTVNQWSPSLMNQSLNQNPTTPWRTPLYPSNHHLSRPLLKSGNHMSQQEEDTQQRMLSNTESNSQNHGRNSMRKQDCRQWRKGQHPQQAKYPPPNTSLGRKDKQSCPPLPTLPQPLQSHPLPIYPPHHLSLDLLSDTPLPSCSDTPPVPDCRNSHSLRSCMVATF